MILIVATVVVAVVVTSMVVMAMLICRRPLKTASYVRAAVSQCPNLGERNTGVWFFGRSGVSNRYLDFRTSAL